MHRSVRRITVAVVAAALAAVGLTAPAMAASAAEPTDLIISEYVEGSSTNKAIEMYNPTDASVEPRGLHAELYFNGGTTPTELHPERHRRGG